MISKLSTRIARMLYAESIIESNDVELYKYGLYILLSHLFFFCFSVICGLFYCVPLEAALFYAAFSLIRSYAGGIHAKTETTCTWLTAVAIASSVCLIRVFTTHPNTTAIICMILFGSLAVIVLAPLDSSEKPLDSNEKKKYRRIAILILTGLDAAAMLAAIFNISRIGIGIAVSLTLEGFLLSAGKLNFFKNKGDSIDEVSTVLQK